MATMQMQIDNLLTALEALLEQIKPLRQRVAEVEKGLAQAQRDYDLKMSKLNAEADRLEGLKLSLLARLNPRKPPPPPPPPLPGPEPTPLPEVIQSGTPHPPPPTESPRAARKRSLAKHIYYFLDSNQDTVMQVINAVLVDDRRDVGDMLEALSWGDIWKACADWETLENQYDRLNEWYQVLEERLAYWQREMRKQESDRRYYLWQKIQVSSQEEWLAFLNDLARQAEVENARLAHEVEVLEQALHTRQTEGEVHNA